MVVTGVRFSIRDKRSSETANRGVPSSTRAAPAAKPSPMPRILITLAGRSHLDSVGPLFGRSRIRPDYTRQVPVRLLGHPRLPAEKPPRSRCLRSRWKTRSRDSLRWNEERSPIACGVQELGEHPLARCAFHFGVNGQDVEVIRANTRQQPLVVALSVDPGTSNDLVISGKRNRDLGLFQPPPHHDWVERPIPAPRSEVAPTPLVSGKDRRRWVSAATESWDLPSMFPLPRASLPTYAMSLPRANARDYPQFFALRFEHPYNAGN